MKTQTAFRINTDLLEKLKEKALSQKRSLNDYVVYLFYKDVRDIPNKTTRKSIDDARKGVDLKTITDLEEYKKSFLITI